MRKKYFILLFAFVFISVFSIDVRALDLTTDLLIDYTGASSSTDYSDIKARIYANIIDKDDVQSNIHLNLNEENHLINVAEVKFIKSHSDIILGKQIISWGSGYNFNPTDVFNDKPIGAAFDPAYQKRGRSAFRIMYYFSEMSFLDLILALPYNFQESIDPSNKANIVKSGSQDVGLRAKFNVYGFDIAFSYLKLGERIFDTIVEPEDEVLGFSMKGSIPYLKWGIWLEAAHYQEIKKAEIVSGLEYIIDDWTFNIEYYKNEFGSKDKKFYDESLFLRGRLYAQNYLIPSISYVWNEKTTLTAFSYQNLNDASSANGIVFDYLYDDQIELIATPVVLVGDLNSEFGAQKEELGEIVFQGIVKVSF